MNLLAGHDSMEFGWLVSVWVPHVRHKARKYEKTVVVCKPEHQHLYLDFTHKFVDYRCIGGHPDMYFAKRHPTVKIVIPENIKRKYKGYDILEPTAKSCVHGKREYYMYGRKTDENWPELIIHARAENKYRQKHRNYAPDKYEWIVNSLKQIKPDIGIASVGTINGAHHIKGTDDRRDMHLAYLTQYLHNAKLCIGTSSGPMHLAHLCGCPILVISGNKRDKSIGNTNRVRYTKFWKAFDIPIQILDDHEWHPPQELVLAETRRMLCL